MDSHLNSLRELIKQKSEELEEYKKALGIMEKLVGDNSSTNNKTSEITVTKDIGAINLNELEIPAQKVGKTRTLRDEISSVIARFGDQEFTVAHVVAVLKQEGKASEAKTFKNRISKLIKDIYENGEIEMTQKGVGNAPHFYINNKNKSNSKI